MRDHCRARPAHGMTEACPPLLQKTQPLQSPPFLQDTLLREKLPRLLWVKGVQAEAQHQQVQTTLPPGRVVLRRQLCPTASRLHWSNQVASSYVGCASVRLQTGGFLGDGQTPEERQRPEMDRFPETGLTRWPRSCPCPSPHSSGRGQPSLQAALRRSSNSPPGS